ncbi:hypothetical protein JXD38_00205, partial [candidate division WOR-3 bacterium]|nr:hypothetical protein [candidate division WOR-3 bacterium]
MQAFRAFDDLSNNGHCRLNFDISATTQLPTRLNWSVSFSDRYLGSLVPGRENNDLRDPTGLGST